MILSRKTIIISFIIVLLAGALLVNSGAFQPSQADHTDHTVVIYGGSFAGAAAAYQAATHLPPDKDVLLIVPESALGSIGTVGGQNFFDIRNLRGEFPTRGSFARWFDAFGQGYNTEAMADLLYKDAVATHQGKVQVLFRHEIEEVHLDRKKSKITGLTVRPVERNKETRTMQWAGEPLRISGEIFVDASDTARLARLARIPLSPGRADWGPGVQKQAATLMLQVSGVDPDAANAYRNPETGKPEFFYFKDADGSLLGWGGKDFTQYDPVVTAYNSAGHRFTLKGYNIAEQTPGTWWLNILLIHEVNGMMQDLDRGTSRWPAAELTDPGQWSADEAYRFALAELEKPYLLASLPGLERPRLLEALRSFPGFENLEFVRDEAGRPVVGEVLYLRETAHSLQSYGGFALPAKAVRHAGDGPDNGADAQLYDTRVGLGLYYIDINAYQKGDPVQTLETPPNPHYIPYAALTTPAVENLLLPGYAQSTSSEAWASMRVIPNLTVCGDAAGVAAACSAANNKSPAALTIEDVREIQKRLEAAGARLDK
ncbi:MAG: FAD-dependent oxidoreductase [Desulforudis sp.]|nr:MAG: FAD-dependent oxidoreductase [Desulforudis sp.]